MTLLSFLIGLGMLSWSGWAIAGHVLPSGERDLRIGAALPVGALAHALLLALLTLVGAPLAWWLLLPLHAAIGIGAFLVPAVLRPGALSTAAPSSVSTFERAARIALIVLLLVQCGYALAHAAVLPTYHIDSLTNWTMRAKVSWLDGALAFDETEFRGVAKPQYPFLVHGVQMAAHVVALDWNDRSANASTLLLTLTSLGSLFLLLRRLRGMTTALVGVAAVTNIPLLAFHLAQGYGDIHLATYLFLGLAFVLAARITADARWHLGSALFVAAACWTKTEGAIIGLLPWLLLLAIDLPFPQGRRDRIVALAVGGVLGLLFPLFLLLKGLPFTPHDSDAVFGFHTEAFGPAFAGFLSPSMGLAWPAIAVALAVAAWMWRRNDERIDCRVIVTFFWGILALLIVLATYTLTPNVRFLLNGESYFRQLMIPAGLLLISLAAAFRKKVS